jgi:hypothetical protein
MSPEHLKAHAAAFPFNVAGTQATLRYMADHLRLATDAELWALFLAVETAAYALITERERRRGMVPE